MQSEIPNKRQVQYDLLRVVATFFVIVVHVAATEWYFAPVKSSAWMWFNIYDSLGRFCVPVFIMISGVFFLDPDKNIPMSALLRRNVLKVAIAFVLWSLLYALAGYVLRALQSRGLGFASLVEQFIEGPPHLWFLFMMAGLYLIVPFLKKITGDKKLTELFLILWFLFSVLIPVLKDIPALSKIPTIAEKLGMELVMGYSGYFVLGYYLDKYKLNQQMEAFAYALGVIGILATVLITHFQSVSSGEAVETYYLFPKPNVVLASIGVFVLFSQRISKVRFSQRQSGLITKMASYAFGMYLSHVFFLMLFDKMGISVMQFSQALSVPLLSVAIFLGSMLLVWILKKIPFLNKYLV